MLTSKLTELLSELISRTIDDKAIGKYGKLKVLGEE
jgi:hypothetical protein